MAVSESRRGRGRPTKLTRRLQEEICSLIEETACSYFTAALYHSLAPQTIYYWDQWGREGRQPYRDFLEAVMQARARAEVKLLREHREDCAEGREGTAGRGQSWLLERRFPEDYDNRFKFDQMLANLSPEQLDEYIATCDAQFGGEGEAIEGELAALPDGDE